MKDKAVTYHGLGRRKSSVARVILTPGTGEIIINGRPEDDYLKSKLLSSDIRQPLTLTQQESAFNIKVNVKGGGVSGQAGAIRLGIARALLDINIDFRPILKSAKMLSRDSRVKERKKYGLRKARKAKQFSKR